MNDEQLVYELKKAAEKWRQSHPTIFTFEINYALALETAANRIKELIEQKERTDKDSEKSKSMRERLS